jgi:biotin transport system substrate-specific component
MVAIIDREFAVAGWKSSVIQAAIVNAYAESGLNPRAIGDGGKSVGLFQLPVFHGGGGLGYLLDPGFGYLAGFLPAAWITGKLARQPGMDDPLALAGAAAIGLVVLHLCGITNLLLGSLAGRWGGDTLTLVVGYSLALLPQLLLCCAAGVLAWLLRRLLLVPS